MGKKNRQSYWVDYDMSWNGSILVEARSEQEAEEIVAAMADSRKGQKKLSAMLDHSFVVEVTGSQLENGKRGRSTYDLEDDRGYELGWRGQYDQTHKGTSESSKDPVVTTKYQPEPEGPNPKRGGFAAHVAGGRPSQGKVLP